MADPYENASLLDLQVQAIWAAFLHRGLKYSSITATSTSNDKIESQYIRTLGESFENLQANCADGSVLFASVLRKIGIEPVLVCVPGHMYLGFYRYYDYANSVFDSSDLVFLETTRMGDIDLSEYRGDDYLQSLIIEFSFKLALLDGMGEFERAKSKFDDDEETEYQIIDIKKMRSQGIMPVTRYWEGYSKSP
jgi:hypothetical protein